MATPNAPNPLPEKITGSSGISFVPLEANPETLTELAHKLGLSPALSFCDVFSLTEPSLLEFIPRPALALLLVFPVSPEYEALRAAEDGQPGEKGTYQGGFDGKGGTGEGACYKGEGGETEPLWFKQTIRNACGLMGMLHAMLNGTARDFVASGTTLHNLLTTSIPANKLERTKILEESAPVARSYGEAAAKGDTPAPDAKDDLDLHYVCFVKDTPVAAAGREGSQTSRLWELDGRRKGPLMRLDGMKLDEDVLSPAALEAGPLKFLARSGGDMRFSAVALVQS